MSQNDPVLPLFWPMPRDEKHPSARIPPIMSPDMHGPGAILHSNCSIFGTEDYSASLKMSMVGVFSHFSLLTLTVVQTQKSVDSKPRKLRASHQDAAREFRRMRSHKSGLGNMGEAVMKLSSTFHAEGHPGTMSRSHNQLSISLLRSYPQHSHPTPKENAIITCNATYMPFETVKRLNESGLVIILARRSVCLGWRSWPWSCDRIRRYRIAIFVRTCLLGRTCLIPPLH